MFDLKPRKYSPAITLALLVGALATAAFWSFVAGRGASGVAVADLPAPVPVVVIAIGWAYMCLKRPKK